LLVAAELARLFDEPDVATYLVETADAWNDCIDHWMYASGSERDRHFDVDGYYVRVAPLETDDETTRLQSSVPVKNVPLPDADTAASDLISCDALALVRFGLRTAEDRRIVNTIRLIDRLLKVETPAGPSWHRYNGDGYGEHADGSPFDGTGIGRAWPLLTGERAHYELQAGHLDQARSLLAAFEAMASGSGLLPEQIWDTADIPERELFCGRAAGSAMPLVWAHAEYVKLRRSLHDGAVFDLPPQTVRRYLVNHTVSAYGVWRFNQKIRILDRGRTLRIETTAPTRLHWTSDDWITTADHASRDTGLDVHVTDLPTESLVDGDRVQFTMFWPEANQWEGTNFTVTVAGPDKRSNAA
ncbi:MAG: glycoside hydrolase family 15 protein, partial [Gemmatimonadales bacterium]